MKTFEERAKLLVEQMTLAEKISQLKYDAPAIERLNIPAYNWWNECLHGVARSGVATVFPQAIGMAASFHCDLVQQVADVISTEARAKYNEYKKFGDTLIYQGLTMWSPNINIFRDPRWGRGHETYGEDPYLTGCMGVAFINGLQGSGKYRKVDATIKHYAVHSGPEKERHGFNAKVSQKDMFETYLWAFEYCIRHANPSAVMGAYNRVNDEPCCASKYLLNDILREKFNFNGYVVSDCGAICDINEHHKITNNYAESAALAVNSGCDLNCGTAYKWLKAAVASGLITEETITISVERLFTARFRLGLFDDDCEYNEIPYGVIDCELHRELNRKITQQSIVLLKNNGILPLRKDISIAVIGPNADDKSVLLGNYNGTPAYFTTFLRGIQNQSLGKVTYAKGCDITRDKLGEWEEQPLREAIIAAKNSDVVIMCMGLNPSMEGEEGDAYNGEMSGDRMDINLPQVQSKLYAEINKVGKPIIFVNISGGCINLSEQNESSDAVIQCFYPGAEGGNALADMLFGNISPSGRLPITFYKTVEDLPKFTDYSMENRTYQSYTGDVVYPFGHGLTYANISEEWIDENTVKISNDSEYDTMYSILKYNKAHNKLLSFKKIKIKHNSTMIVKFNF